MEESKDSIKDSVPQDEKTRKAVARIRRIGIAFILLLAVLMVIFIVVVLIYGKKRLAGS
ncbi:MAG: hypothetical protein LKJ76_08210 [Lachnospiraceae bacterium]|jgi:t-SNARE complex subunit (syntaxin)|nr:hypothetical protein [Lachnospiraceae bacterium]